MAQEWLGSSPGNPVRRLECGGMSDLAAFMQELRQAGAVESSDAAFTVSLQTAEDKLQRFALPRPELYIVQFVAAAVASGASFLTITSGVSQLEFLADGAAPTQEELANLNSYLFYAVDAPEYLSELAVGVQGALAMPVNRVLVESFGAEESWQLEVREGKQRVQPLKLKSPLVPLLRIVVDKGFGLRTRLTDRHPEQGELWVCQHAPLDLTFDDRIIATPAGSIPGGLLGWADLDGAQLRRPVTPALLTERLPDVEGLLFLTKRWGPANSVALIVNGVTFNRPATLLGPCNLSGTIAVRGLRKNISRTDLAQNADYRRVTEALRAIGWRLLTELCRDPEKTRDHWDDLRIPVNQALTQKDLPPSSQQVLSHWMDMVCVADSQGPGDHLKALRRARQMTDPEQARQLRTEILNEIQERLLVLFHNGAFEKMFAYFEPLRQALDDLMSPQQHRFLQAQEILHSLLGKPGLSEEVFSHPSRWGRHRQGLLLRYAGRLVDAAKAHAAVMEETSQELKGWAYRYCAEIELAQGHYEVADRMLSEALKLMPSHRDLKEEMAFLKRLIAPSGRGESVRLLQQATPPTDSDPFVQFLFLDWLTRDGRGVLPMTTWVEFRARASMAEVATKLKHGKREQIEERLNPQFDLVGWESLKTARERRPEAVVMAEKEFGPNHSYTQFARRRAVYQLHRLEAHDMADKLQCRGHLLAQLERCVKGLDEEVLQDGPR